MVEDQKLSIDEMNRVAQHEAIKGKARQEIEAEIERDARAAADVDRDKVSAVGGRLREKAISEVASTEAEIDRGRAAARISQIVDYIFYFVYGLIALEIFLELLGAREGNAFKEFVDAVTAPLLVPFVTLMPDLSAGRFQLKISYLVALAVYLLLHGAINGILRMMAHRKTAV